jgi:DHA1 family bicyclomycin/chloramphenicol resistance-like MFS transporter
MRTKEVDGTPSFVEFVVIVSLMMSLTALSIDAMLPALPHIGQELRVASENSRQLVVSVMILGLALGQLVFGPLSDRTGRKPAIYAGYALYIIGALLSGLASSFPVMLLGRLLQGGGAAAPRAVTLALVRDRYAGRVMARVMSFVMTVFILVPMVAPTLGQAIMQFAGWRAIFGAFIFLALLTASWFAVRMEETLAPHKRAPFTLTRIRTATAEILRIRQSLAYTISAGLIGGAFLGYLNSSQQILQEQYGLAERFPLYFATISLAIGAASLANSRLVLRFGMRMLVWRSLLVIAGLSMMALVAATVWAGQPPLWLFLAYLMSAFFAVGILFGNQNALAMEPLGHIAGIGSAIVGSLSTLLSMPLGTLIGQLYNGTVMPLIAGLALLSGLALLAVWYAEAPQPALKSARREP